MASLQELWKRRNLPGTIDDFVNFLGAQNQEQLETMDFVEMEHLPGVKDRHLVSCGGTYLKAFNKFKWLWTTAEDAQYQRAGENFTDRGETYDAAALSALVVYWELLTYRKKQSLITPSPQ